jgi:flagellar assembly protein FliH
MSSRIVRGEARGAAAPAPWTTVLTPPQQAVRSAAEAASPAADRDLEGQIREAREAGLREGRAEAEQCARSHIEEAEKRLARAAGELATYRARLRREAERDVVLLAIGIAQRILHRQVATDPEALHGLVKASLENLEAREIQRVRVHPDQAAVLEAGLLEIGVPQRLEVIADSGIEPGGLIFETARGNFDASVGTQLDEIKRGFADLAERRSQ